MPELERFERTIRGIPFWLLQEYLQELGGARLADGHLQGRGWEAWLEQVEDYQIGSLRVGQVRLVLEADPTTMAEILPPLEKKTLRAGG
jgi:hypothetical protein